MKRATSSVGEGASAVQHVHWYLEEVRKIVSDAGLRHEN
jgi:hypothetical protein